RAPPVRRELGSAADPLPRGYTPNELARLLRVGPDRIRAWIKTGELGALDTAPPRSRKPRYVILPVHLEQFERRRQAATPAARPVARRKKRSAVVDFYPD